MTMMNSDPTENVRRSMVAEINSVEAGRAELEAKYGKVWNTSELQADFEVTGFMAPFVVVKRKADNKVGSLMFQGSPRFYFSFTEDK
jgi:ATP-dependent Zn protease